MKRGKIGFALKSGENPQPAMHELLAIQLRKHFAGKPVPQELAPFLGEVDRHYRELDAQRRKQEMALAFNEKVLLEASERALTDQALLRGVMDIIPDLIFIKDNQGRYLGYNKAYERVMRVTREERPSFIGKTDFDVLTSDEATAMRTMDEDVLNTGSEQVTERWLFEDDPERRICLEILRTPYHDQDGRTMGIIGLGRDITARRMAERQAERQASVDVLTALANRNHFMLRLQSEMNRARRNRVVVGLVLVNLSRFKDINDLMGHNAGDAVLKEVARRLNACVRDTDLVARLGGDEFALMVPNILQVEHVGSIAQKVLRALAQPFSINGKAVTIASGIGIALYPVDGPDPDTLLQNAEQAMYYAKSRGQNRYSYFTPALQEATSRRRMLLGDLSTAVEQRQFHVMYQPIVNMDTGGVFKAEALVRWNHPEHGNISPGEFIPLAEETGYIAQIGDFVFREAAELVRQVRSAGYSEFQVSVNVSPLQFNDPKGLVGDWIDHLGRLGLPGNAVAIEITEGLLLQAKDVTRMCLGEMRNFGMKVSLDDFGTGYSSLAYLKKLDIDYLKIDQSFVRDLEKDQDDRAMCEAMIVMAHKLGLKVVAEGIETPLQREILLNAGCDFGQGYLFAKPLLAVEFARYLGSQSDV